MTSARIIVIHGYGADPGRHWFPWLRSQYRDGVVEIPAMPNPEDPRVDEWVATAREAIGTPTENTVLVGHSLGCITLLRVLESTPRPWSLAGLILVAGFSSPLPGFSVADPFTEERLDASGIIASTARRHVVASDDDESIPPAASALLAQEIDGTLTLLHARQHFSDSTEVRDVEELLPLIDEALGDRNSDARLERQAQ